MPTGTRISNEKRALLVHHKLQKGSTVDFVMDNLFLPDAIAEDTIKKLWRELDKMNAKQIESYISGLPESDDDDENVPPHGIAAGSEQEDFIVSLLRKNRSMRLRVVTAEFHKHFHEQYEGRLPGMSTVYKAIKHTGMTHKRVTWQNIHRNADEQIQYLDDIMSIHPDNLVDVDGMVQSKDDFFERYGWSYPGEACIRMQIVLRNKTYAVMAAYSTRGFLFYQIFEGTVKGTDVASFLNAFMHVTHLCNDVFMILDNASNQKTQDVRDVAERVFRGRYMYCSPYSPELKPIERGFSNVKNYIRERDQDVEWQSEPIKLIEAAFDYYSVSGLGGCQAHNHFQIYCDNHQMFNDLL